MIFDLILFGILAFIIMFAIVILFMFNGKQSSYWIQPELGTEDLDDKDFT